MNIDDYFAVEPLIVEHLREQIPELADINTPFNIDDMLDNANEDKTVSVIYYGDRVSDVSTSGKAVSQYQQWLVVLTVRDQAAQSRNTNSIRAYANPLILKLLGVMQGYNPNVTSYRHFKRADCPATAGSDSGFAYFPFLFEIQMFIKGD